MKTAIRLKVVLLCILITACSGQKDQESESTENIEENVENSSIEEDIPSPRKEAKGTIEGVNIVVDYGSPAVKGRKIWGGLEAYDKVWRAGANATTSVSIDKDVMIQGQPIQAGKYAFFIIPKENEDWIMIFNKDWDEWGAFNYDQSQDVMRIAVAPEWVDQNQERLTYKVTGSSLDFAWEKARISLQIESM